MRRRRPADNSNGPRQENYYDYYYDRPKRPTPDFSPAGGQRRTSSWKRQALSMLAALGTLAVWHFTPLSEWITNALLDEFVPLSSDVELGHQAVQESFRFKERYDARWSPMLKSVQRDLAQTLRRTLKRQNRQGKKTLSDVPCLSHYLNYDNDDLFNWNVEVIHERNSINALALPGGFIRVTDQLLHQLEPTRGEIAALVGHEMGHVLCRHSQARILNNQLLQLLYKAFLDSGDNSDERKSRQYNHHGVRQPQQKGSSYSLSNLLLDSASFFGQQQFSRRDEFQAGAVSWALLQDASNTYTPESLHSLLAKLGSLEQQHAANGRNDQIFSTIEAWSRTHPATQDRLAALEDKWNHDLTDRERQRLSRNPI